VRRDRPYRDDFAHKTLVETFDLLGPQRSLSAVYCELLASVIE